MENRDKSSLPGEQLQLCWAQAASSICEKSHRVGPHYSHPGAKLVTFTRSRHALFWVSRAPFFPCPRSQKQKKIQPYRSPRCRVGEKKCTRLSAQSFAAGVKKKIRLSLPQKNNPLLYRSASVRYFETRVWYTFFFFFHHSHGLYLKSARIIFSTKRSIDDPSWEIQMDCGSREQLRAHPPVNSRSAVL